jgi:hypothetical protein
MSAVHSVLSGAVCVLGLVAFPADAQVLVDYFNDNHIDPGLWSTEIYGYPVQMVEQNQQLEYFVPAASAGGEYGARLVSVFQMRGDFDIQVDFSLLQWPNFNGVRSAVALTDSYYDDYGVERSSLSPTDPLGAHEVYVADFGPLVIVETQDLAGKLRLVRSGGAQTGYYWSAEGWVPLLTDPVTTADIKIQLHVWSHDYCFQHHDIRGAFDNFTVVSGELVWPATPTEASTWGAIKGLYR